MVSQPPFWLLCLPPVVEAEHDGEGAGGQQLLVVVVVQAVGCCQGKSVSNLRGSNKLKYPQNPKVWCSYQNCTALGVDIVSFNIFVPQKSNNPGVRIRLNDRKMVEEGISYLGLAPSKDPSLPVRKSTTTFRNAVKRRSRKRSYNDFWRVGRVELLRELTPSICSWVEFCYFWGGCVVWIFPTEGQDLVSDFDCGMLDSSQGFLQI